MTENTCTHCLLCSLNCPLALERDGRDGYSVNYLTGASRSAHGLCGRGTSLVDLVQHRQRLSMGLRRVDDHVEPVHPERARQLLANMAEEALGEGPVALIADGNLPCEDLVVMQQWAADQSGHVEMAVHIPVPDLDALDGLASTDAETLSPEDLSDCDGAIIIGDVLASHPVLGRSLLDRKYADPRALFLTIDALPSVTARLGGVSLIIAPGAHQQVLQVLLAALEVEPQLDPQPELQQLAALGAVDYDDAVRLVRQLHTTQRPAVVMAP
jgi:predicted molibdopterin-dependent oxidoreductase YjgC